MRPKIDYSWTLVQMLTVPIRPQSMSGNDQQHPAEDSKTALSGIRVLDLGRVLAAPFAAQVLGDLGAEVIKVERPDGGDDTRPWKPPEVGGNSAYFASINRNKRSVTLDFSTDEGRKVFLELVRNSDVVIQNFRPGVTERLGIDYEKLNAVNPKLIYCSISGFGQQGPLSKRAAYDYIVQAFSGVMSLTGDVDGDPVRCAGAISDYGSGIWAVVSILRRSTAKAQNGSSLKIWILGRRYISSQWNTIFGRGINITMMLRSHFENSGFKSCTRYPLMTMG